MAESGFATTESPRTGDVGLVAHPRVGPACAIRCPLGWAVKSPPTSRSAPGRPRGLAASDAAAIGAALIGELALGAHRELVVGDAVVTVAPWPCKTAPRPCSAPTSGRSALEASVPVIDAITPSS